MTDVIRIAPYEYIHIQDRNQNVTRVVEGPTTYNVLDHEKLVGSSKPKAMVVLPPRTYCIVKNPVQRQEDGSIVFDKYKSAKLNHGETEYRFQKDFLDPFPLYPGEVLQKSSTRLQTLRSTAALHIKAIRDFTRTNQGSQEIIQAGDEYLFKGPGTYYPRIEETIVRQCEALIVTSTQKYKFKAL